MVSKQVILWNIKQEANVASSNRSRAPSKPWLYSRYALFATVSAEKLPNCFIGQMDQLRADNKQVWIHNSELHGGFLFNCLERSQTYFLQTNLELWNLKIVSFGRKMKHLKVNSTYTKVLRSPNTRKPLMSREGREILPKVNFRWIWARKARLREGEVWIARRR